METLSARCIPMYTYKGTDTPYTRSKTLRTNARIRAKYTNRGTHRRNHNARMNAPPQRGSSEYKRAVRGEMRRTVRGDDRCKMSTGGRFFFYLIVYFFYDVPVVEYHIQVYTHSSRCASMHASAKITKTR